MIFASLQRVRITNYQAARAAAAAAVTRGRSSPHAFRRTARSLCNASRRARWVPLDRFLHCCIHCVYSIHSRRSSNGRSRAPHGKHRREHFQAPGGSHFHPLWYDFFLCVSDTLGHNKIAQIDFIDKMQILKDNLKMITFNLTSLHNMFGCPSRQCDSPCTHPADQQLGERPFLADNRHQCQPNSCYFTCTRTLRAATEIFQDSKTVMKIAHLRSLTTKDDANQQQRMTK